MFIQYFHCMIPSPRTMTQYFVLSHWPILLSFAIPKVFFPLQPSSSEISCGDTVHHQKSSNNHPKLSNNQQTIQNHPRIIQDFQTIHGSNLDFNIFWPIASSQAHVDDWLWGSSVGQHTVRSHRKRLAPQARRKIRRLGDQQKWSWDVTVCIYYMYIYIYLWICINYGLLWLVCGIYNLYACVFKRRFFWWFLSCFILIVHDCFFTLRFCLMTCLRLAELFWSLEPPVAAKNSQKSLEYLI